MAAPTTQSVRRSVKKTVETVICRIYLDNAQSGLTGNSFNKILFDTALIDSGKNFDTTNHKFVAPVTGLYHIKGQVVFGSVTATKRYVVAIYKNGSGLSYFMQHSSVGESLSVPFDDELFLQANDYIEIYGYPAFVGSSVGVDPDSAGILQTLLNIRLLTKEGIRQ